MCVLFAYLSVQHMCAMSPEPGENARSLELELQAVVTCRVVLGIGPRSSLRILSSLNCSPMYMFIHVYVHV